MLVLARGESQEIIIGEHGQFLTGPIVVKLVRNGLIPRIGIEAQKDLKIVRGELEQKKAA